MQKTFTFGSSPLSRSKTLVALLVAFTPVDIFFKRYTGRKRNELINAAGLGCIFFQRWIQNFSIKISVFMCKSLVHFIVPPPPNFRLGPSHFVWSRDGTAGSLCLFISFLEYLLKLGTKNFVIRLVIWMFFCLLLPLPFPASKKIVFMEYCILLQAEMRIVLCYLMASHCNLMAFNFQIRSFIVAFLRVRQWVVHYASTQLRHLLYKQKRNQEGWGLKTLSQVT